MTKVKVGQTVSVAFAATGKTVAGTVTAIATQDTVTNNVVDVRRHGHPGRRQAGGADRPEPPP